LEEEIGTYFGRIAESIKDSSFIPFVDLFVEF
jgi:hypothetical protein